MQQIYVFSAFPVILQSVRFFCVPFLLRVHWLKTTAGKCVCLILCCFVVFFLSSFILQGVGQLSDLIVGM